VLALTRRAHGHFGSPSFCTAHADAGVAPLPLSVSEVGEAAMGVEDIRTTGLTHRSPIGEGDPRPC